MYVLIRLWVFIFSYSLQGFRLPLSSLSLITLQRYKETLETAKRIKFFSTAYALKHDSCRNPFRCTVPPKMPSCRAAMRLRCSSFTLCEACTTTFLPSMFSLMLNLMSFAIFFLFYCNSIAPNDYFCGRNQKKEKRHGQKI